VDLNLAFKADTKFSSGTTRFKSSIKFSTSHVPSKVEGIVDLLQSKDIDNHGAVMR
jgi:hypothetical protein